MKSPTKVIQMERGNENMMVRIKATNLPRDTVVVVPETHSAILMKDGQLMATLNGGRYPVFDAKSEKKSESVSVEVIYFSKTVKLQANWGTRVQFNYRDPETDLPVHVGARGVFEVQIRDPRKAYLELIGVEGEFNLDDLRKRLAERMMSKVEPAIARVMLEKNLPYDRISYYKEEITQSVQEQLSKMFEEEYGLRIFSFTFIEIFANEEDARAIEAERNRIKQERLRAQREEKAKAEALEQEERQRAREERSEDRQWEREKFLLELKQTDYAKYLEVCKAIGWEPEPRDRAKSGGRFCPNCGEAYGVSDRFCPNCGHAVGNTKKVCPKCGKENPASAKFCPDCGTRL